MSYDMTEDELCRIVAARVAADDPGVVAPMEACSGDYHALNCRCDPGGIQDAHGHLVAEAVERETKYLREIIAIAAKHEAEANARAERAIGALRLLCDNVQFDGFGGIEVIDVLPLDADTDEAYDAGRVECVLRAYDAARAAREGQ